MPPKLGPQFSPVHGQPGHQYDDYCPHCADTVYIGREPEFRSEVHIAAGFKERNPAYLLQKHKERQARRKR